MFGLCSVPGEGSRSSDTVRSFTKRPTTTRPLSSQVRPSASARAAFASAPVFSFISAMNAAMKAALAKRKSLFLALKNSGTASKPRRTTLMSKSSIADRAVAVANPQHRGGLQHRRGVGEYGGLPLHSGMSCCPSLTSTWGSISH